MCKLFELFNCSIAQEKAFCSADRHVDWLKERKNDSKL